MALSAFQIHSVVSSKNNPYFLSFGNLPLPANAAPFGMSNKANAQNNQQLEGKH